MHTNVGARWSCSSQPTPLEPYGKQYRNQIPLIYSHYRLRKKNAPHEAIIAFGLAYESSRTLGKFLKKNCSKNAKTYNSWDSRVVTHRNTSQPVRNLSTADRTGSPVFSYLWSYVLDIVVKVNYNPQAYKGKQQKTYHRVVIACISFSS